METMTSDDVQLDAVLPALKSCPLFGLDGRNVDPGTSARARKEPRRSIA